MEAPRSKAADRNRNDRFTAYPAGGKAIIAVGAVFWLALPPTHYPIHY